MPPPQPPPPSPPLDDTSGSPNPPRPPGFDAQDELPTAGQQRSPRRVRRLPAPRVVPPPRPNTEESSGTSSTTTVSVVEKKRLPDLMASHVKGISFVQCLLCAVVVVLSALLFAAATTNRLSDVYVLSISYKPAAFAQQPNENANALSKTFYDALSIGNKVHQVRIGYFGMCAKTNEDTWVCHQSPASLIQALDELDQTDPLNLIWLGNRFRDEGLSLIMLLLTLVSASLGLLVCLTFAQSDKFALRAISSCITMFTLFSALNLALWQHLASSISMSIIKDLSSGAITCRTGPEAIAIGWVGAFVALANVLPLVMEEHGAIEGKGSGYASASVFGSESTVDADARRQEDDGIEMEEPRRQPSWQQTQMPNFAWLQAMMYVSGMADREMTAKHRNTTTWVNQTEQMRPGFAETVVETEGY